MTDDDRAWLKRLHHRIPSSHLHSWPIVELLPSEFDRLHHALAHDIYSRPQQSTALAQAGIENIVWGPRAFVLSGSITRHLQHPYHPKNHTRLPESQPTHDRPHSAKQDT